MPVGLGDKVPHHLRSAELRQGAPPLPSAGPNNQIFCGLGTMIVIHIGLRISLICR
jgi:hypothetical protein